MCGLFAWSHLQSVLQHNWSNKKNIQSLIYNKISAQIEVTWIVTINLNINILQTSVKKLMIKDFENLPKVENDHIE